MFSFEIPEHHVIVTASSDGFVKMWKLKQNKVGVLAQCECALMQVFIIGIVLSEVRWNIFQRS